MKTYTFAIIKPDAVANHSEGFIISQIIEEGFTVEGVVRATWPRDLAEEFYVDLQDKPFYADLVAFMSSGPSYSMILSLPECGDPERVSIDNAVAAWRALIGATDPKKAEPDSIRAQFGDRRDGAPMMRNAVHGSDSSASVIREITLMRVLEGRLHLNMLQREWREKAENSGKLAG